MSLRKISEKNGFSRTVIKRVLKENGIEIRKKYRKYQCATDIFRNIDSSEKAYWLGFLAADGCNYRKDNRAIISINLSEKDRPRLEKRREFFQTDAPINEVIQKDGFSNLSKMVRLSVNSLETSNDLLQLGVTPRKSLTLKPPKIKENFYLPFILGYFDGDGSISEYRNGEFGISFVGTKEVLLWINSILNISSKLEKRDRLKESNNYYIRCGGTKKPYSILKQLYDSSNIYLDRKFRIYKKLETVVLSRNAKRLSPSELLENP